MFKYHKNIFFQDHFDLKYKYIYVRKYTSFLLVIPTCLC